MDKYFSQNTVKLLGCVLIFTLQLAAPAAALQQSQRSGATLSASFQYMLANFSGAVPSQWARVDYEPQQRELYTLTQGFNEVRIFNPQGMEIFAFGGNGDIVSAVDIASAPDGNIYILARDFARYGIQVLDFRGQPKAKITIKDLPQKFGHFNPDRMEQHDNKFYLLDSSRLQVISINTEGQLLTSYDLKKEFEALAEELDPEKKNSVVFDISGFSVGPQGSVYFTVPTLFTAFRLNPNGKLDTFGRSGSGPGKFGVISGIVADELGNIYVADRLRSVVMIFDRQFTFLGEFGYRGDRPEDMLVPDDLAIDLAEKRIFVSQAANKGVGVYKISLSVTP